MELSPEQRESLNKKPYEAIVVMPYSSGPYREGRESEIDPEFGLATYESKLVTLAAVQAYAEGQSGKVILVGEDTVESGGKHSTTDFMKELLVDKGFRKRLLLLIKACRIALNNWGKFLKSKILTISF